MYPAIFLNLLSRVEIFESANNLKPCGRANRDIFESDDVAKLGLVFIDTNKSIDLLLFATKICGFKNIRIRVDGA